MRKFLSVVAAGSLLAGCADAGTPNDHDFTAGIDLNVAALNLQGVSDVVWDLQVENGNPDGADVVWQQRITSSSYGDGAGSASYVGPCDAGTNATGADASSNTVSVWVVGVYDAAVNPTEAGGFNEAVSTAAGDVDFQNPTWYDANTNGIRDTGDTDTPLTRVFTCVENRDVFVQFDVALMRPAQQGFFDIAVNFNSIFCSAKFDCAYPDFCVDTNGDPALTGTCAHAGTACTGADQATADGQCPDYDINLLHNASSVRDTTYILGFACTAGAADTGKTTTLLLDDIEMDCGFDGDTNTFTADFTINTNGATDGNQCVASGDLDNSGGLGTACTVITNNATNAASYDIDSYLYQVAIYKGQEQLTSGGVQANKAYWNIALGVNDLSTCILRTVGTADDSQNDTDLVNTPTSGPCITAGTVYPYITWNIDPTSCTQEPLTFGDPNAMVGTSYTATGDTTNFCFDHSY